METEAEKASLVAGGTASDQLKYGTLVQHLERLDYRFKQITESGLGDPSFFRTMCEELLRSYETERVMSENDIKTLEVQIAYVRAKQNRAALHANLLLGVLTKMTETGMKKSDAVAEKASVPEDVPTVAQPVPLSDTERLKTICACACQDQEDAKTCPCSCHKGIACNNPRCNVCPQWTRTGKVPKGATLVFDPKPSVTSIKAKGKKKRAT